MLLDWSTSLLIKVKSRKSKFSIIVYITIFSSLFFVGKGVTYDTGGADLKTDGHMRGMSRDKCGAATLAGFMKSVSLISPTHVNITCYLGFVRNSIGSDAYVSDEIITSRDGCRVLVGNTDAEGRMVMADLLCKVKEEALAVVGGICHLFTVATLTGHAIRAWYKTKTHLKFTYFPVEIIQLY